MDERGEHDKAAEFIIYQEAPGCGKTSLLNHLRGLRAYYDVLFVTVGPRDLADEDSLRNLVSRRPEQENRHAKVAFRAPW